MIAAALAALALLAPPVTAVDPTAEAPAPARAPAPAWEPCVKAPQVPDIPYECATVRVPLDYRDPARATLDLPLIRVRAADPARRIGTLVLQPGGPGNSGVDFVRGNYVDLPAELRDRFDVLGFDARGVGRAAQVRCWDDARYSQAVTRALGRPGVDGFQGAVGEAVDFNRACLANSADRVSYVGTGYVARDLDLIRESIGEEQLSFYGRSFGTFIGTVYADAFPARVRAMALDGAYDPIAYAERPYSYDLPQFLALDQAVGRLLDWCRVTPDACAFGDGDPRAAFERLVRALDENPVPIPAKGTANGYTLVYRLMFNINGGRADWPDLAAALTRAEARDPASFLLAPPTPGSFAFLTPNVVVECNDRVYPEGEFVLASQLVVASRLAPLLGPTMAYGPPTYDHNHAPACTRWPAERASRHDGPYTAEGSAPLLVLGTTGDPDTPYRDAVALTGMLDNARLLTFQAEGHTAFGRSSCARDAVVRYLADGVLPPEGTVCADEKPAVSDVGVARSDGDEWSGTVGADETVELIGVPD